MQAGGWPRGSSTPPSIPRRATAIPRQRINAREATCDDRCDCDDVKGQVTLHLFSFFYAKTCRHRVLHAEYYPPAGAKQTRLLATPVFRHVHQETCTYKDAGGLKYVKVASWENVSFYFGHMIVILRSCAQYDRSQLSKIILCPVLFCHVLSCEVMRGHVRSCDVM